MNEQKKMYCRRRFPCNEIKKIIPFNFTYFQIFVIDLHRPRCVKRSLLIYHTIMAQNLFPSTSCLLFRLKCFEKWFCLMCQTSILMWYLPLGIIFLWHISTRLMHYHLIIYNPTASNSWLLIMLLLCIIFEVWVLSAQMGPRLVPGPRWAPGWSSEPWYLGYFMTY